MITTKSVTYFDHKSEAASWAVSNIVNFVFAIPLRTLIIAQVHKESLNWPLDRKISKANLSNVFVSLQILRITLLCPMVDVVFLIKFMFPNIKHIYIYITMCTFFCFGRYFGLRTCWRSQSFGSNHWICCHIILRQENDGVWLPCSLWKWCRCRTSAIDRRFRVLFCDLALRMCFYCCKLKRKHFRPPFANPLFATVSILFLPEGWDSHIYVSHDIDCHLFAIVFSDPRR